MNRTQMADPVRHTRRRNESGIAMIAALGLMAVAAIVMMLLFMRTMDEVRHGADDAGIVQSLLVAHGGANLGIALLRADIREQLDSIASARSSTTAPWSFGGYSTKDGEPEPHVVASDLAGVAQALQPRIDLIVCGANEFGDGQVLSLRIYVTDTACGEPLPGDARLGDGRFIQGKPREHGGDQRYGIPFVMVADGTQGEFQRRIVTQGEYQFDVGRASFARYALFTDEHVSATANSSRIWFTSDTMFDGPVHTNGNFNFYGRPWFGGEVTSAGESQSAGQGAYGYDGTASGHFFSAGELDDQGNAPNLSRDGYSNRPQFADGVDFRAHEIELPTNAHDQEQLAEDHGIYLGDDVDELVIFAADASGNPLPAGSIDEAAFQYVRATLDGSTVTYRIRPGGRLERWDGSGWDIIDEDFNGLIYVDGDIESLRGPGRSDLQDPASAGPAVAAFAQLTIVPEGDARITGDLVYEDQPCEGSLHRNNRDEIVRAICDNLDAINVLGIFTPTGNIQIGHNNSDSKLNAPVDVRIQGSLLTSTGIVTVEDYDGGTSRGAVQLLGGIIEKKYGAFGTFNGSTGVMGTGYSREFTFDPRLRRGLTPPFFPTVGLDGVKSVFTYTFGHREQIY